MHQNQRKHAKGMGRQPCRLAFIKGNSMKFNTFAAATAAMFLFAVPAFAEDLTFDLINNSSVNLHELYVSAHDADDWGEDILGTEILAAEESGAVTITDGKATCDYDLRFVSEDGSAIERANVNLCETGSFTLQD